MAQPDGGTNDGQRLAPAAAEHFRVSAREWLGESANAHWLVERGGRTLVLRRFREARSLESANWEAQVVGRLADMGHPVPRVVDDVLEIDSRVWMLMTHVVGTPGTYADDDQLSRGRALAELHMGLSELVDVGQRDGRMLTDEIVNSPTLDGALAYFATVFPGDARVMQWHLDRIRQRFDQFNVAALPTTVIHGDFAPWNLLFVDHKLTGIVDFDLSHLSYRVADFALSWRGKYDNVVVGFNDAIALTEAEWSLLSAVRWGWLFFFVEDAIADMRDGRAEPHRMEWVVDQLLRRSPMMGPDAEPYLPA